MIGNRYGRLRVTATRGWYVSPDGRKVRKYLCICDCGRLHCTRGDSLKSGICQSCGCLRREIARERATIHGMDGTKEHEAWHAMIGRCHRKSHISYKHYGKRGIRVCREWRKSFLSFYRHIGPAPTKHHQVDRYPDNDGDYKPGNVRWATPKENSNNRHRRK